MKLKKSEFKKIIKECLMEILVEGFGEELPAIVESKTAQRRKVAEPTNQPRATVKADSATQPLAEQIGVLAADPVMASIFADTASTTLKEQAAAGRPNVAGGPGSDQAARMAAQLDPVELPGGSKWADLAFSSKKMP